MARGFGSPKFPKDLQRKIAAMGGKAAQSSGRGYRFTSEEARAAAAKCHALGVAHQFTPEEAAAAGRKGGMVRAMRSTRS